MKPDLILSAIIMLTLIFITWIIRDTVIQPIEPICEKEGSPIPCKEETDQGRSTDRAGDRQ